MLPGETMDAAGMPCCAVCGGGIIGMRAHARSHRFDDGFVGKGRGGVIQIDELSRHGRPPCESSMVIITEEDGLWQSTKKIVWNIKDLDNNGAFAYHGIS